MCAYVLPILNSGCNLEWRDNPTSHCLLTNFYTHGNNLIPISIPTHLLRKLAKKHLNFTVLAKQNSTICTNNLRTDIGIKLLP